MINPDTVSKLKLLKELVDIAGSNRDIDEFNTLVVAFQENEILTKTQAKKANRIYKKLKRFKIK